MLCDNLEGWDGVGGRKEVQEGGDVYTYGLFMLMYSRNQRNIEVLILQFIFQLKVNNFKIKKKTTTTVELDVLMLRHR